MSNQPDYRDDIPKERTMKDTITRETHYPYPGNVVFQHPRPRWRSFEVEQPKIGDEIVAAQIERKTAFNPVRHEIVWMTAPFVVASIGVTHAYQTHWCLASELPVVEEPVKRDYCKESWESLPDFKGDYALIRPCKCISLGEGKVAISMDMFRPIWNMAVYAAKIHGVDKV